MYAILNDRGHQYKVREGDLLQVDSLSAKRGAVVTFDQVLLVGQDGGQVTIGSPTVAGARVTGVLEDHVKGAKVIAHRRVWTNSKARRHGHRSHFSIVRVQKIEG